jgi:hypothetical protein
LQIPHPSQSCTDIRWNDFTHLLLQPLPRELGNTYNADLSHPYDLRCIEEWTLKPSPSNAIQGPELRQHHGDTGIDTNHRELKNEDDEEMECGGGT